MHYMMVRIDFYSSITRAKCELYKTEFEQCLNVVSKVLEDGNMGKSDIDDILLVAGSTRIPKVQSMIKQYFNSDEAVACDVSIQAAIFLVMMI